jgi:hypothetical protein
MTAGNQREIENALSTFSTPFDAQSTAAQNVQFSIDPNQGLSKRRYLWYSNGSQFDTSLFTDVESGIRIETTATATDEARIHSSISGQYVAQTLAKPGIGMIVDDSNSNVGGDNLASISHGEIYFGAFWWDDVNDQVDTGVGYKLDDSGWYFFVKSRGSHLGDSPVAQTDFTLDKFDSTGSSGQVFDPAEGHVFNFPYTWYNQGPFEAGLLNTATNSYCEINRLDIDGRSSTETPNFPVQLVVRNDGTADSLGVELGGMQYATYGGGIEQIEFRETDETRITAGDNYISSSKVVNNNSIDPTAETGNPLISIRRESGSKDLSVAIQDLISRPVSDDIYVFQWDEWNPGSALTGANFTDPATANNSGEETQLVTDTEATDYTPSSDSVLRSVRFFEGGDKNKTGNLISQRTDTRVEIGATRVITAVNDGDATADVDPFFVKMEESF